MKHLLEDIIDLTHPDNNDSPPRKKQRTDRPLHRAASKGDNAAIKGFTPEERFLRLQEKDEKLCTPLHYAASKGFCTTIEVLLEGLTAEQIIPLLGMKLKDGRTPLHHAANKGNAATIEAMRKGLTADQWFAQLEEKDIYGYTALHYAACCRSPKETITALRHGLTTNQWISQLNSKNKDDRTPLEEAKKNNHAQAAKILSEAVNSTQQAKSPEQLISNPRIQALYEEFDRNLLNSLLCSPPNENISNSQSAGVISTKKQALALT